MPGLVVGAIGLDQLLRAIGREPDHLLAQAPTPDVGEHLLVVDRLAQNCANRMAERLRDQRPRIDDGAVEIEEGRSEEHRRPS